MTSKRLWVTTAIILALSTSGPHSSGVWAQSKPAVCAEGWEWVGSLNLIVTKKKTACGFVGADMWIVFLRRVKTPLGKIRVLPLPCWTPRVVVLVSVQAVIAPDKLV